MKADFVLLKRTYPVSETDRYCDGYLYILDNTTVEERMELKINIREDLQREIKAGEKYIYQVGKINGVFKTMCLSFKNYEIIRKKLFKFEDE